jgi:hypothetical protein
MTMVFWDRGGRRLGADGRTFADAKYLRYGVGKREDIAFGKYLPYGVRGMTRDRDLVDGVLGANREDIAPGPCWAHGCHAPHALPR